ncbi:hypothetical protein LTR14_011788 [Exophiala xenobiotica]|nr:hypothetical protein LTR14_011788 [Exophiala xenobiotica]
MELALDQSKHRKKVSEARSNTLLQVLKNAAATSSLDPDESVRKLVASSQTKDALPFRSSVEQAQHGEKDIDHSVGFLGNLDVLELQDS